MVKSMNAAIAGLKAHQTKMDVISHNIANVNTWGFKSRSANFQDAVYSNYSSGSEGNTTSGGLGGINTSQIGYGATVSSISTNHGLGSGQYTGNSLDCMIDGPAFFIVGPYRNMDTTVNADGTEAGNGVPYNALGENGLALSRVGIFQPDSNGYLVDNTGNYVYGYAPDENGEIPPTVNEDGTVNDAANILVPIRILTVDKEYSQEPDAELLSIQTWSIGTDGTIVGVDSTNTPVVIGKIAVASVENPSGLEQDNGYLYNIGNNAGRVHSMETTSATGVIKSNFLEMSNVDLASDMASMITTQRGYQANTKIITVTDEMLEQLVNMKR